MNIFVLESDADSYRPHLDHLDANITYSISVDTDQQHYDIVLAQPDLAAEYLRSGSTAQWIQSTWAGVRPLVDVMLKQPKLLNDTLVTGVKGVFGGQIAEYVFTYLLEEIRKPAALRQQQQQHQWQPDWPSTLANRKMVILGTGSIGRHLAMVARAFGLNITGVSRSGQAAEHFHQVVPVTQLARAVEQTDYLVAVLPDTPAASNVIDQHIFTAMRNSPLLLNVGRASSIDHPALLQALEKRQLRGAVLDVFAAEPLPQDDPLWDWPNVTVTPHIAAVSYPADVAAVFLHNLEQFASKRPLSHLIDPNRGY